MHKQKSACLGLVLSIFVFGAVAFAQGPEESTPIRSSYSRPQRGAPLMEAEIAALPQTTSASLGAEQTLIPLGSYTAVLPLEYRVGQFTFNSGEYNLILLAGGKYQMGRNDWVLQSGTYTVTPTTIEFISPAGMDACSSRGTYRWQLQGNRLAITAINLRSDSCLERVVTLTTAPLFSNDPAHNVWKNIGPSGGRIWSLLAHDGKVFAGTDGGGIFVSADNGQTWKATRGIRAFTVFALAAYNGVLFAGGNGQRIYVSTDGGDSWEFAITPPGATVYDFVESGGQFYAATLGAGVWRMGANPYVWEKADTAGLTTQGVYSLATIGNNLFAGTDGGGVFVSTNGGANWTQVSTGITQMRIRALAADGTKLYASSATTPPNEVFVSENNGQMWTKLGNGIAADFPAGFTNAAYKLVPLGGKLFAAGTSGVLMFDGTKWSSIHTGSPIVSFFSITASGNTLFAGAWYDGVSRSTDGGVTWAKANNGLTGRWANTVHKDNGVLYAGVNDGVFTSRDEGQNWTRSALFAPTTFCFLSFDNKVYAGTTSGVYVTGDQGQTWTRIVTGLAAGTVRRLIAVGNTLYAAASNGGVFRSTDGGANWTAANTGLASLTIYDITALGNNLFVSTSNQGVFRSTDGGANWTAARNGLPAGAIWNITTIGNALLAPVVGQAIYRSEDDGQTWTKSQDGVTIPAVYVLYTHNGVVYAGPDGGVGVLRSLDQGRTWQMVNGGFDSRFVLNQGFFASGSTLYVASFNGVYVSHSMVNRNATVSAASFSAGAIADKAIVSAFGTGLATGTAVASSQPLPTTLAGTTVRVTDSQGVTRDAPLFFVSDKQINYQIPAGTATGAASVTIINSDGIGATGEITVRATAPTIFTLDASGAGAAAAVDAFTFAPGPFNATQTGGQPNVIAVYGTGLGGDATDVDGNVSANVQATIDGNLATVLYAGRAPGFIGANQFNVVLPTGITSGTHTLTLRRGGVTSNSVTLTIR